MPENAVLHECWSCGVRFWITARLDDCRKQDHGTFYCPNGHGASFHKSEADLVREELAKVELERDRLKQNAAMLEETISSKDRELIRVRRRVQAGVCPCCNRTFQNLRQHMANEHPDGAEGVPAKERQRQGQQRGGRARAANLTPERRKEIARKAAETRWHKDAHI